MLLQILNSKAKKKKHKNVGVVGGEKVVTGQ